MKQAFIDTLEKLMEENKNIVTITADMGYSVFESIQKKFPKRFFNTGITEQSSTSVAAGLALM
ncbi:1-deoxy-D-xylulose-5-phosphate synthase, partial [Candidatus Roizmanbacteria bacterium CG11_big_fil_rev_8_21_14_0_20_37_16]